MVHVEDADMMANKHIDGASVQVSAGTKFLFPL